MVSTTLYLVATTTVLYTAYSLANGLWKNVQKARSTGLSYFVVRESLPTAALLQKVVVSVLNVC